MAINKFPVHVLKDMIPEIEARRNLIIAARRKLGKEITSLNDERREIRLKMEGLKTSHPKFSILHNRNKYLNKKIGGLTYEIVGLKQEIVSFQTRIEEISKIIKEKRGY